MKIQWSEEHDALLKKGVKNGLTAKAISEAINANFNLDITRNAVLGRVFRLGLTLSLPHKAPKSKLKTQSLKRRFQIAPLAEHIKDMRDSRYTWREIGKEFGVTGPYIRLKAIEAGIVKCKDLRWFTPEDTDYIIKAWQDSVPVEDIADALNRSFGVIRQKIYKLQEDGIISTRDPNKTRLLRQYGERALAFGSTPTDALKAMAAAKIDAVTFARKRAKEAKELRYKRAIAAMWSEIDNGVDRNEAIFNARMEGVTLDLIAKEMNVTRERIRQICHHVAEKIALKGFLDIQNAER